MKNTTNKPNIGVITHPTDTKATEMNLINFVEILEPLANEIYIIAGRFPDGANRKKHVIRIKSSDKVGILPVRILKYLLVQMRVSFNLLKISKFLDIVIFFAGTVNLLPVLSAKLLGKKTVMTAPGLSSSDVLRADSKALFGLGRMVFSSIFRILERINFSLADNILVQSESVIRYFGLEKYGNKISSGGIRYVNTTIFKIDKPYDTRENIVGYVGRLSREKGVMNFVDAMPLILKNRGDVKFMVGGEGKLLNEIEQEIRKTGVSGKVSITGWIPHERLPYYLNELKLFVLPSYTEGLPVVLRETMACGTPILTTPVGGVPDLIKEGETGFILEDNSPECIARNVIRALSHPDLDKITSCARKLMEDEYNYEAVVEKCRVALPVFWG